MRKLPRFLKRLAGRDGVPAEPASTQRKGTEPDEPTIKAGDVVQGTVAELRPNSLGLDLGGQRGWVSASRLGLGSGGVKRGPYQVGHVLPVQVLGTNDDGSKNCDLVIKVGDVLEGTVAELRETSLGVDIKGFMGWVSYKDLELEQNVDEVPYQKGDVLAVRVAGINAGYGSFNCEPAIKVGDELEGTVADLQPSSLGVKIKGWQGWVPYDRLGAERQNAPYREGDVLPVRIMGINRGAFDCAPTIKAGDTLLGTVKERLPSALRLDVGGQLVTLTARRLGLPEGGVEGGPHKLGDRMIVQVEAVHDDGTLTCAPLIKVGDELPGTIKEVGPDSLSLDVEGWRGWILADNLRLRAGEVEAGPYKQGHVLPVQVLDIDRDGVLDCELVIKVGDVLEGTVSEIRDNSLRVDIKGFSGWVSRAHLGLEQNAVKDGPYSEGDVLRVLCVGVSTGQSFDCKPVIEAGDQIDGVVAKLRPGSIGLNIHGRRGWVLAHRLGLRPGEVESGPYEPGGRLRVRVLAGNPDGSFDCAPRVEVGDELFGTIKELTSSTLRLNVGDQSGFIPASRRLGLRDGEVENGPYKRGDRMIVRVEEVRPNGILRCAPHIKVGDLLIGKVAEFHPNSLGLDVDGRRVWLSARSLRLPDGPDGEVGNSAHVKDWMIVRVIDVNAHGSLHCERVSSKATPEDLNSYALGQPVKGIVLLVDEERGLAIDLESVVGWVNWAEVSEGQRSPPFWIGTHVFGHVSTKNAEDGSVAVTLEQASTAAYALLTKGDVVVGRVSSHREGNRGLYVQFTPPTIYGVVPTNQIPIEHRDNQRSIYPQGSLVSVEVAHIDREAPLLLSITGALRQRNAAAWRSQVADLQEGQEIAGTVISSDLKSADVDIGAVIARIWREEQSLSPDSEMALQAGDEITAVITRIDDGSGDELPKVRLSMRQADPSYADAISEVDNSIVEGVVVWVRRHDIGVDIGPVTGRAPRRELPVMQGEALPDVYELDERVRVKVLHVDSDKKQAALSVGRAEPLKHGTKHPEFLDDLVGKQIEARCVKVDDREAKFEIPGSDLRGLMPVDEFSLEAGATEVFKVGDTITTFVRGVAKDSTIRLSLRRAQDGWSAACARIKKSETLQGVVVEVAPRGGVREGGVRVDLGPLTEWVGADEVSLDTDVFSNETYSIGDRVGVYVVDAGNLGEQNQRLELSLRRAMEEWDPHAQRISEGSLMTGRVLPGRSAPQDGVVRIDLGAVNGRVSAQELDGTTGDEVNVVVRRFEISDVRAEAEVSLEGYADRWDELVGALPDHRMITAECVRRDGTGLEVDLGSGLICRVPASEWAMDAGAAVRSLDSYSFGDSIDVRIAHIAEAEQAIVGTLLTASQQRVAELLRTGVESGRVEFKPGLKNLEDRATDMESLCLRAICSFLNTDGGTLIIGVRDRDAEPVGLELDNWAKMDDAQNKLVQLLLTRVSCGSGADALVPNLVKVELVRYKGVVLLLADCQRLGPETQIHDAAKLDDEWHVRAGATTKTYRDAEAASEYFTKRRNRLIQEEEKSAKPVAGDRVPEDDAEERDSAAEQPVALDLAEVIAGGETEQVEFKSTLRVNLHTGEHDDRMRQEVIETIAGFLNHRGGTLIVGVADDGSPVGIDADKFANEDQMSRDLADLITTRIESKALGLLQVSFDDYRDVRVLIVRCEASKSPTYANAKKGDSRGLYVRVGTSTRALPADQIVAYIDERFG